MRIDAELMQMVKKLASGGAKTPAHTLRTVRLMPLGPCDLVVSSVASSLYTSTRLNLFINSASGVGGRLVSDGASNELTEMDAKKD